MDKNLKTLNVVAIEKLAQLQEEGQPDFVGEILEIFYDATKNDLYEMKRLSKGNDFAGIKKIAHRLKSSCGNIGAEKMSLFCHQLELTKSNPEADDILLALTAEYELVKKALLVRKSA